MQPLGIVGPDAEALAADLAPSLDGRVATVTRREDVPRPPDAVDAAVETAPDGRWTATGTDRDLTATLDALAPDYDFALVVGAPDARIPTVVLGESPPETRGPTVAAAETADAVDIDAVLDALGECEPHVTLETLVDRAKRSPDADRAGAVATFTGRVRARDAPDDDRTTRLEFEKYEGVAEDRMAAVASELEEREGVFDVRLFHRTGVIEDGEDIVFVVVLAGHRGEAFRTVEDGIDRLKDEVPIFKKETTESEEFWVHDR